MDVFFCDLCGARVTDTDLSAGQGQRKGYDVICAACIHKGQGQAWTKARDDRRTAASRRLDEARDRAATIDDHAEPPSAPTAILIPEPEPEPEAETTQVEPGQGLSDMAGGMMAMAPSSIPKVERAGSSGSVEVDDLSDSPRVAPGDPSDSRETTPSGAAKSKSSSSRTTPRPPSSSSSNPAQVKTAHSGKQSKSSTTARATSKTSAKRKAGQPGMGMWIAFGAAIVVMLVVGVMFILDITKTKPVSGSSVVQDNLGTDELKRAVDEARSAIVIANEKRDKTSIQAALDSLTRVNAASNAFEKRTEKDAQWLKLSEEERADRVSAINSRLGVDSVKFHYRELVNMMSRTH